MNLDMETAFAQFNKSLNNYRHNIRAIETRKARWQHALTLIFNASDYAARHSDGILRIENKAEPDGRSSIIVTVHKESIPHGRNQLRDPSAEDVKTEAAELHFCQAHNGKVLPVFIYPYTKGWMDKGEPKIGNAIAIEDFEPEHVFTIIADFIDDVNKWEDDADFSPEYPRKKPIAIPPIAASTTEDS